MNTITLIYHFAVIVIALVIFFLKVRGPNNIFTIFCQIMGKLVPIFCILYAGVQIFKYFGII